MEFPCLCSASTGLLFRWTHLLSLLEERRKALMGLNDLMTLLRDIDTLASELKHLEVRLF